MQSHEFVSVYPSELTEHQLYSGPLKTDMKESREWSHIFGELLHNRLAKPDNIPTNYTDIVSEYRQWLSYDAPQLLSEIVNGDDPDKYKVAHELSFHSLNFAMLDNWVPLLFKSNEHSRKSSMTPQQRIDGMQNSIALNAMPWYLQRNASVGVVDDYPYYAPKNFTQRKAVEGILNEADLAVVSLQALRRHPTLHIVPAPMQFERGKRYYNTDFVIVSDDDQVIGLQGKANVNDITISEYDPERIVLVDSKTDFESVSNRRITPGRTKYSRVGWGGVISVNRVANIKTVGKDARLLPYYGLSPRIVNSAKQQARSLVGDPKNNQPNFERCVGIVSARLLSRLGITDQQPAAIRTNKVH